MGDSSHVGNERCHSMLCHLGGVTLMFVTFSGGLSKLVALLWTASFCVIFFFVFEACFTLIFSVI